MNSTILITLAISALVSALSIGLEYAIAKKQRFAEGGIVQTETDSLAKWGTPEIRIYNGEAVFAPSRIWFNSDIVSSRAESRHCDYCKTVQGVGNHCLNCGAPLS